MSKITILTFVKYYLPGYKSGGPVRTIANMVQRMGDEFHFRIVTSDRDAFDSDPYEGIPVDEWQQVGKAEVFYCSPGKRTLAHFRNLINNTKHDVLYLNSFFDTVFTILPLLLRRCGHIPLRPLILAPRGEFSPGAIQLKKIKKSIYRAIACKFGLYRNITWHASGPHERKNIQETMKGQAQRIVLAPNLVPPVPLQDYVLPKKTHGQLRILFLSRICPKKNLKGALKILAMVNSQISLNIYGVIDDKSYWGKCQRMFKLFPANIKVAYRGPVNHSEVFSVMAKHDLFFLPTLGENFGHAIYEALACGLPVLISDQTPWHNLEAKGIGWDLPLSNPEQFCRIIEMCAGAESAAYTKMRINARRHAEHFYHSSEVISQNRKLFCLGLQPEGSSIV